MKTKIMLGASPNITIDPEAGLIWLKGFLLLGVVVVLVYLTIKALLKHGKAGDTSASISMVGAMLICLIPLGLATSVAVVTGYGGALLSVVTKVLS